MRQVKTRKIVVSTLLAFLLALGAIGGYAAHTSSSVHACVSPSGAVKVVDDSSDCRSNERGIELASLDDLVAFQQALDDLESRIEGLESDVADINSQLAERSIVSENGLFSIDVGDQGIVLSGPSAEILVGLTAVEIDGIVVDIASAGPMILSGSVVSLGCPGGGGLPLVRTADTVLVSGTTPAEGDPIALTGFIIGGTSNVIAC